MPATSGLGLIAVLVVPAMIKPQSVGLLAFIVTAVGYLMILGCSQWFAPNRAALRAPATRAVQACGHDGRGGASCHPPASPLIPGFDRGTFPQGSRLNPWGSSSGLNPMISLGNSLRSPTGEGRMTYASTATSPPYLQISDGGPVRRRVLGS